MFELGRAGACGASSGLLLSARAKQQADLAVQRPLPELNTRRSVPRVEPYLLSSRVEGGACGGGGGWGAGGRRGRQGARAGYRVPQPVDRRLIHPVGCGVVLLTHPCPAPPCPALPRPHLIVAVVEPLLTLPKVFFPVGEHQRKLTVRLSPEKVEGLRCSRAGGQPAGPC